MSDEDKLPKIITTPRDRKNFPSTNQVYYCWQKYNEYVLCMKRNNGDEDTCFKPRRAAMSICPLDNISMWDDQRAAGNFLGVQEHAPAEKAHH